MTTREAIEWFKTVDRSEQAAVPFLLAIQALEKKAASEQPKRLAPFPWRQSTTGCAIEDANGKTVCIAMGKIGSEYDKEVVAHILAHSQGEPDAKPEPLPDDLKKVLFDYAAAAFKDDVFGTDEKKMMNRNRVGQALVVAGYLDSLGEPFGWQLKQAKPQPESEPVKVFDDMESLIDDLHKNDVPKLVPNPITGQMQPPPPAVDPAAVRCGEGWASHIRGSYSSDLSAHISRTLNLPEIRRIAESLQISNILGQTAGDRILACLDGLDGKEAAR